MRFALAPVVLLALAACGAVPNLAPPARVAAPSPGSPKTASLAEPPSSPAPSEPSAPSRSSRRTDTSRTSTATTPKSTPPSAIATAPATATPRPARTAQQQPPPPPAPTGPNPKEFVPTVPALAPVALASLPKTPADAEAKCNAGMQRACGILGAWLLHGQRGTENWDKAAKLLETACKAGEPESCAGWVNNVLSQSVSRGDIRLAPVQKWSCDNGSGFGCWLTGEKERTLELYKKECDGGYMGACVDLGVQLKTGDSGEKDAPRATTLFLKACNGGNAEGCDALGGMHEEGLGVPQNDSLAKAFYTRACTMGSKDGCGNLKTLVDERRSRGFIIR